MRILFQGDSVTDAHRTEGVHDLGSGYPRLLEPILSKDFELFNRGISGNRTCDLVDRWQEDCIDLKPDIMSILIGINDTWRKFSANDETTVEAFRNNYEYILKQVKDNFNTKIIIMEPFVLGHEDWRDDLNAKIEVVRVMAEKYSDAFVPLDSIINDFANKHGSDLLWEDGVHPKELGFKVIANSWLNAFEKITGNTYNKLSLEG